MLNSHLLLTSVKLVVDNTNLVVVKRELFVTLCISNLFRESSVGTYRIYILYIYVTLIFLGNFMAIVLEVHVEMIGVEVITCRTLFGCKIKFFR